MDLFATNTPAIECITDDNLLIYYIPQGFTVSESNAYYKTLKETLAWRQDYASMFGKQVALPRLSAWYGDTKKSYTYSGIHLDPLPWTPALLEIKQKLESYTDARFNSVLCNLYRDGRDYVSWHTDAEPELGRNPIIGSANFGETRKFQLRRIDDKANKKEFELKHGTILIMAGETQHFWQHQVPKSAKVSRDRINLTFRTIVS